MPEARVQLTIEIETEGAEQLTALRHQLDQLGQSGPAALARLDTSLATVLDRLQQARHLVASSTREFLQHHRQLFASLEPIFQSFFQRLLAGSRNFRDLLKRLFADLLQFFLRTIEQMVAAWLTGFRRLAGSGGGLLGGLLPALGGGGLFGGGALGLAAPLLSAGFGFRLGPGGTAPTFPTAGGGGLTATNIGLLAQLGIPVRDLQLGGLTLPGSLLASGGLLGVLAGFQTGSRTLGALGGAAAGFAFGGPLGAIIGAIGGFFAGLFGRGKKKRQATKIAQEGFAEMRKIVEQFKKFEVDFETALAALNALWEQMQSAWRQLGKSIFKRSASSQRPNFDALVSELKQIQQVRQSRARLLEALPIPEFQFGGLVRAIHTQQGRILAFLHEGEAVLNRRAVQALGEQRIGQLNRASLSTPEASAPRPVHIQIFIDARGQDPQQIAAFAIRRLTRELADRGLRLG